MLMMMIMMMVMMMRLSCFHSLTEDETEMNRGNVKEEKLESEQ